jgi:predicted dehydrogenase
MLTAVLVGCGAMSARWLEAIARIEDLRMVGFVDVDEARARARAAEYGHKDVLIGSNLGEILAAVRPDLVFDVVTPQARRDVAIAAFAAGCHVLSEKPLAVNLDDARAILAAAQRSQRVHAVVQNRRYVANVRRMKRLLESGALGAITSIHADFFVAPHFGGFREAMDHVLLLDMAIHTFDVARYLVGRRPRSVHCLEWQPANSWYQSGSSAAAFFEFDEGIVFDYRGSWCAVGLRTSWESRWRIVCTNGTVAWDGFDDLRAERMTGRRDGLFDVVEPIEVPPLDSADRVGGHFGVIEDFVAAIRSGGEPETKGADNINSLAMALAAAESAASARRVAITI